MNEDLHKLRERGYDGIANEIENAFQRWDDGLKRRRATAAECYLKEWTELHIRFAARVDGDGGIPHKYLARLHLSSNHISILQTPNIQPNGALVEREFDGIFPIGTRYGGADCKNAMLINSIHLIKLPEGVSLIPLSSMMRLQRFDEITGVLAEATNHVLFCIGFNWLISRDGKHRASDLFIGHDLSGRSCERISKREGQVIEGGASIEKAISNDEAQRIFWNLVNANNPEPPMGVTVDERLKRGVRVWLIDDLVGVSFDPSVGLFLEGFKMYSRTI